MRHVYRMSFMRAKIRLAIKIAPVATLFLLFLLPTGAFADTKVGSAFSGRIDSVIPCLTVKDASLISITHGSGRAAFIYKKDTSKGGMPLKDQYVYGVTAPSETCVTALLGTSNETILYYGTTTPDDLGSVSGMTGVSMRLPPGGAGAVSSGFGALLAQSVGGLVTQGISGLANQALSGILGGTLGSVAGAAGGIGIFGGMIVPFPPVVCDEGFQYMVTGIPYSGPLMWLDGVSALPPYLYAMGTPPVAGPIIGHYSAYSPCTLDGVPAGPGGLIMNGYGTGIP
jgi:hypothetical protein